MVPFLSGEVKGLEMTILQYFGNQFFNSKDLEMTFLFKDSKNYPN